MKNPPIELLKRCRRDDRKAHFELYEWCFQDLLGISKSYFKNEDELKSVVNTAFLNMVKSIDFILKEYASANFYTWMKKITIRCVIDEFRRKKKYAETIDLEEESSLLIKYDSFEDHMETKERMKEIQHIIDSLPEMSRTVFNLYAIEGFKHHEIGEMLNISSNTSKVHLFKARQKLQAALTNTQQTLTHGHIE
jgi:RNA polymerase sigma factor (sigma-70 family)